MGKTRYLIDTNILIYYFAGDLPRKEETKIDKILGDSFNISIVTKIEFLGWKKHTQEGFQEAKAFFDSANVIVLSEAIADLAISLRRKRSIKLPDAVIAATAIEHKYTLITRNENDFKDIGVSIYNPFI